MAIAALLIWTCTVAVGTYLLATGLRARQAAPQSDPGPMREPARVTAPPGKPVRPRDRFDPPSLTRAKSEPLPGLRALAEFIHPALAITGFAFWLGYVLTRDRMFAAIGLGVLLATICAGLTWFTVNTRAARRPSRYEAEGEAPRRPGADPLSVPPRLLLLHAAAATATLLLVALTAALT